MIDVSALMSLQNACGGPLSPPDTFFDLCIAFLPVSGKSIFFPFLVKNSSLLFRKNSFLPFLEINSFLPDF